MGNMVIECGREKVNGTEAEESWLKITEVMVLWYMEVCFCFYIVGKMEMT